MSVYMRNNIECYEYHVNPEQSNNADVRSSSLLLVLRRQSRMDQAWVGGWQAVCVFDGGATDHSERVSNGNARGGGGVGGSELRFQRK